MKRSTLPRHVRLSILAALILSGCGGLVPSWPSMPEQGTCRNFAATSWGGGAPWDELRWGGQGRVPPAEASHVWIDEPMLQRWGWPGSYDSAEDVCGAKGLKMVKQRIAQLRAETPGVRVWLNWSTDEIAAISRHCPGETWHQGADVFSFDSYGGLWDWEVKTRWLLDMFYGHADAEHRLGLVPEAFREKGGANSSDADLVQIAMLYWEWAMRHDDDGRIYAVAPFHWGPCGGGEDTITACAADMPRVVEVYSAMAREYPRCPAP